MLTENATDLERAIKLLHVVYIENAAGCCLHCVADDGNVDYGDVEWALEFALKSGHSDCEVAARAILALTQDQREELYERYDEYSTYGPIVLTPTNRV